MEKTITPKESKAARLTIRIGGGTLSFSVADSASEQQIVYEPYTMRSGISTAANLREAFHENSYGEMLRAQVLTDAPVLLVPVAEFQEENCGTLYRHTFTGKEQEVVMHSVLPSLNAVAVFSLNKDLKQVIDDRFDEVRYLPVCAPVWNHLHRRSYTGNRRKLYVYFHDKKADIFSFQQNRFRFSNSYEVSGAKDAVYFILFVWQQLALDQQKDELHLVGTMPDKDDLLAELRLFLRNTYIVNPSADFNRAPITTIKGLPYDLMTLYIKGR